jgi:opacity protein-like surface antigen
MNQLFTLFTRVTALSLLLAGLAVPAAYAQDDLLKQLDQPKENTPTELVDATFKSTRLINGHTVQTPGEGTLVFIFSHNFGTLNSGAYQFFGLDNAEIRLALEYGITNRLEVGVGRSSLDKTFDGFLKYKAIQQTTGTHAIPVSVTLFSSAALASLRFADGYDRSMGQRLAYTYQALIARKFSTDLSLQLMPTLIHRNLVMNEGENNDIYAVGGGGRYKVSKRMSLNAEYYYLVSKYAADNFRNSLGIGVDIETGGHIFQLHVTNSKGMIEKQFVGETTGNFFKGDLFFGFIVSRNFTVKQRARH